MDIIERKSESGFVPITGHSLHVGKVLAFQLQGFPFRVIVHREGIQVDGKSPIFPAEAMRVLIEVLRLAEVHHKHLAGFAPGEPQTFLSHEAAAMLAGLAPPAPAAPAPFNTPALTLVRG